VPVVLLERIIMEIDNRNRVDGVVVHGESRESSGGFYSLPVVGHAAAGARRFYDELAPQEIDSTEVRVAKEIFRWSSAVAGAAAVAVIVL
jgi:hypothetical protein